MHEPELHKASQNHGGVNSADTFVSEQTTRLTHKANADVGCRILMCNNGDDDGSG